MNVPKVMKWLYCIVLFLLSIYDFYDKMNVMSLYVLACLSY